MKQLKLEDLSVEQKLGQLICARSLKTQDDRDFAFGLMRDHALGGVQAPVNATAVADIIEPTLANADYPILIGADMERGFQNGDLEISSNLAIGALDEVDATYAFVDSMARQAKSFGWNMIWGPVVDAIRGDTPLRTLRAIGGDKELIARHAMAYIKAFADNGVVGTVKHFPSIFDRVRDTHMWAPISYHTREEFMNDCLYPYRELIRELGDDMIGVMSSHVNCVNIDPEYPATLSKPCIDMLREIGFDGMLITDSLAMMGIVQKYGDDKIPGMAVAAGHDLILPNYRVPLRDTYNSLVKAYREGVFDEQRLNDAVHHVLKAQAHTVRQPENTEVGERERILIDHINRDSICAVVDEGLDPALDTKKNYLFVILKPNDYSEEDLGQRAGYEIGFSRNWDHKHLAEIFKEKFPNSDFIFTCEFPHRNQNERVCAAAAAHEEVIFLTFCEANAYQGTDGLTERIRHLISTMQYHIPAIIHVGNPYAFEKVVHIPRLIFGFPHKTCMDALPAVLAGEIKPTGKLPFAINLPKK